MCGLNGIFAYHPAANAPDNAELLATRDAMRARGPDGYGAWRSDNDRCALAHRRLSFLDLSDRAAQPMLSEDRLLAIVFNGDVMNTAARLEELSRNVDGGFLASRAAMARFSAVLPFAVRDLGRLPIRGRADGIDVVGIDAQRLS